MHDNGVTLQKRVLQNLDIPYSYELAKRMEQYRSHPTLGYRPAGSKLYNQHHLLRLEIVSPIQRGCKTCLQPSVPVSVS